jgi:hypothetical protein
VNKWQWANKVLSEAVENFGQHCAKEFTMDYKVFQATETVEIRSYPAEGNEWAEQTPTTIETYVAIADFRGAQPIAASSVYVLVHVDAETQKVTTFCDAQQIINFFCYCS